MTKDRLQQSYDILDSLRLDNNLYVASASSDYNFVWLRDSFYEVLPYLDKPCNRYEDTYHAILDILNSYRWKFDPCHVSKPRYTHEYIHPRYNTDGTESLNEWGNCQHDAIGAILFGIGQGELYNKRIIRDKEDRDTIQSLVYYLNMVQYWQDEDNGMWEEGRELHSSSIGAVVAGLKAVEHLVTVPDILIKKGQDALNKLLPNESPTRKNDLSQLSLIYPYNVVNREQAWHILLGVERNLLRNRGIIRYKADSYYNSGDPDNRHSDPSYYYGKEAEWTFGLPWMALVYMHVGNTEVAKEYIQRTEEVMLDNGALPELYYANTNLYNGNTPLGWSNSMFILAKEAITNMELNEGFTLTCNYCGNTTNLTQNGEHVIDFSNTAISTDVDGGWGYYGFWCKNCDEQIQEEY